VTLAPTAEAALPDGKIDYLVKIETGEVHPWPHQSHVTIGLSASGQSVRFHSPAEAEEFARHPNRAERVEELRPSWEAAREKHRTWWAVERQRRAEEEAKRRAAQEAESKRQYEAALRAKWQETAKKAAFTRRYQAVLKPQLLATYGERRISWLGNLVATDLARGAVTDAKILERAQHILGSQSASDAVVRLARERAQEIQNLRASRSYRAPSTTPTLEDRLDAYLRSTCSEQISAACMRYLASKPTYVIRLGAEPAVAYASSPIWPRYYSRRRYPIGHDYTVTLTVPRSWCRTVLSTIGSAVVDGHVILDVQPTDRPQLYAATWLRKSRGHEPALVHGYVTRGESGWSFADVQLQSISAWKRLSGEEPPPPKVRQLKRAARGATLVLPPVPNAPPSTGRRTKRAIRFLDLDESEGQP
jgi:hypothetical protein